MKKHIKQIVLSSLAAVGFAAISVGTTFALFTSNAETAIEVTSGKVSVDFTPSNLKLYSAIYGEEGSLVDENGYKYSYKDEDDAFENGGVVAVNGGVVSIDKMTPGDKVTFTLNVNDRSNVDYKYRFSYLTSAINNETSNSYITLVKNLNINADYYGSNDTLLSSKDYNKVLKDVGNWTLSSDTALFDRVEVSIELPIDASNENQDLGIKLAFSIEAIQGNAYVKDDDSPEVNYIATNIDELIGYAAIADAKVYVDFDEEINYLGVTGGDGVTLTLADGVDVIGVTNRDGSLKQTITVVGGKTGDGFHSRIELTGEDCSLSNVQIKGKFATTYSGYWGRFPQVGIHVMNNKVTIDNCDFEGSGTGVYKFINGTMKDITIKNSRVNGYSNFVYTYLPTYHDADGNSGNIDGYRTEFADGGKLTIDNCVVTNITTYSLNAEGNGSFLIKNSDFCLVWSSYGENVTAEFIDCVLSGSSRLAGSRAYQAISYTNCVFGEEFGIAADYHGFDFGSSAGKHIFKDCKIGSVDITKDYILSSGAFEGTTEEIGVAKYVVDEEEFEK